MQRIDPDTIDPHSMLAGYIECALWADFPEDDPRHPIGYEPAVIDPDNLNQAAADCEAFTEKASDHLRIIQEAAPSYSADRVGHDFWLSRNGHGTGFFDRPGEFDGPEESWEALQEIAESFGNKNILTGDDGKVYIE